jgi:hypothetical protein
MALMVMNFNSESEKPEFLYKRNPLTPHVFQIFQFKQDKGVYEPVGTYTLLDVAESLDLTEKKVMNLISIMNGKQRLVDFTKLTQERILFNIVPNSPENLNEKVIFRTYDGNSVSKENAVLEIEKGVFEDEI